MNKLETFESFLDRFKKIKKSARSGVIGGMKTFGLSKMGKIGEWEKEGESSYTQGKIENFWKRYKEIMGKDTKNLSDEKRSKENIDKILKVLELIKNSKSIKTIVPNESLNKFKSDLVSTEKLFICLKEIYEIFEKIKNQQWTHVNSSQYGSAYELAKYRLETIEALPELAKKIKDEFDSFLKKNKKTKPNPFEKLNFLKPNRFEILIF